MEGDTRPKISAGISGPGVTTRVGMVLGEVVTGGVVEVTVVGAVTVATGADWTSDVAVSVDPPSPQAKNITARRPHRPPRVMSFKVTATKGVKFFALNGLLNRQRDPRGR